MKLLNSNYSKIPSLQSQSLKIPLKFTQSDSEWPCICQYKIKHNYLVNLHLPIKTLYAKKITKNVKCNRTCVTNKRKTRTKEHPNKALKA